MAGQSPRYTAIAGALSDHRRPRKIKDVAFVSVVVQSFTQGRPDWDYLLPPEALSNPNWGCMSEGKKPRGRPMMPTPPTQTQADWLLDNDIDVK
jgi:hypothetical protein